MSITLENVFDYIELLPRTASPFAPSSTEEKAIRRYQNNSYKGLSLWLRNLVGGEELSPIAYEKYSFKYLEGMLWKARFDLLVGLVPKQFLLCSYCGGSPVALWYMLIHSQATVIEEQIFEGTLKGAKQSFYEAHLEFQELIENHPYQKVDVIEAVKNFDKEEFKELFSPLLIFDTVIWMARSVAFRDDTFKEDYLEPWQKAEKKLIRKIRRQKGLSVLTTINGKPGFRKS